MNYEEGAYSRDEEGKHAFQFSIAIQRQVTFFTCLHLRVLLLLLLQLPTSY